MPFNRDSMTRSRNQAKSAWYYNETQRLLAEQAYDAIAALFGMGAEERALIDFERIKELRRG